MDMHESSKKHTPTVVFVHNDICAFLLQPVTLITINLEVRKLSLLWDPYPWSILTFQDIQSTRVATGSLSLATLVERQCFPIISVVWQSSGVAKQQCFPIMTNNLNNNQPLKRNLRFLWDHNLWFILAFHDLCATSVAFAVYQWQNGYNSSAFLLQQQWQSGSALMLQPTTLISINP